MLDLDSGREASAPRPAATLVLLRDATPTGAVEVFCVERNKRSRFLGGAIVFPGGRVEDDDGSETWRALVTRDDAHRALGVAACRETLEEAAILLADAPVSNDEALALRTRLATDATALRAFLVERKSKLDLASLVVMSRWITPKAESRRFDAHFFVARAPHGQRGAHDMTETMASFWASPRDVLARFDRSEIQLAPPTHRTLQLLAEYTHVEAAARRFAPPSSIRSAPSSFNKATRSRSRFRAIPSIDPRAAHRGHVALRPPRRALARRARALTSRQRPSR